jgi:hypothetical protein
MCTAVLVGALIGGCGPGSTTPVDVTPDPATTTVIDGRFELRFTVDRTTLRPGDNITGTAELHLRAGGSGALSGSSALFGFEFAEVGGERRTVYPVYTPDCAPHQVGTDSPLITPILKSGAYGDDDFVAEFLEGNEVHLPAGLWDITAVAGFYDGRACTGQLHSIRAPVRVTIIG